MEEQNEIQTQEVVVDEAVEATEATEEVVTTYEEVTEVEQIDQEAEQTGVEQIEVEQIEVANPLAHSEEESLIECLTSIDENDEIAMTHAPCQVMRESIDQTSSDYCDGNTVPNTPLENVEEDLMIIKQQFIEATSKQPSKQASKQSSKQPSKQPSKEVSTQSSAHPSVQGSKQPSNQVSNQPSTHVND